MLETVSAGYEGKMQEGSYGGYTKASDFFCVLEVYEGYTKEQGDEFLGTVQDVITHSPPQNLQDFDEVIGQQVKKANLPIEFSLASGYRSGSILYLKTIGSGEVFIKRGTHFQRIITGDNNASGHMKEHDLYVFSSSLFMEGARGKEYVSKLLMHHKQPFQIVDTLLKDPIENKDEVGMALFVLFTEQLQTDTYPQEFAVQPELVLPQKKTFVLNTIFDSLKSVVLKQRKPFLLLTITLIVLVFLFNIKGMLGKKQEGVGSSGNPLQLIEEQLKTTEESTDIENALGVIVQSRQKLEEVKKTDKSIKPEQIKQTAALITTYESKILKREVKQPEEFYDLTLEEKGGRGDRMSLNGDKAVILNKEGKIYILSLATKSPVKKVYGEIANANIVAAYDNSLFFYRQGAGMYQIKDTEKPKRILEDDKNWGNITDASVYNGNIYLLDQGKDEIYKYLVTENSYSDKNSYVKSGSSTQFKKANSLSIDSAVYVGFDNFIIKYIAGEKQPFKSQFPGAVVNLVKSFTTKDLDNVFSLDTSAGIMYVLTKEGDYVKQIQSPALTKANDFVVYKDGIYILSGTKILKIIW